MAKRIITVTFLFIISAALPAAVVLAAVKPSKTNAVKADSAIYQNTASASQFTRQSFGSLRLKINSETENPEQLKDIFNPELVKSKPSSSQSPIHLFYKNFKLNHPWTAYDHTAEVVSYTFNNPVLGQTLLDLNNKYNRPPQNADLKIENSRAVKFTPHKNGLQLLTSQALWQINRSQISQTSPAVINIPVLKSKPKVKLSETNDLGINELVARGVSDFSGSSRSRIHNISVGASQFDGLIIQPGEEFSFNRNLGPVTAREGYLPELVIKSNGTVPEYGGGLCQVSSTAFRAAFFGGLPITERKNHSYAVQYYKWINEDLAPSEGLDATIYPGVVDMKFVNDTKGAILISTHLEGSRLYFDFYGTPDNRKVAVDGPYTYDRRPSGAVKATVSRTVASSGEVKEQTFNSSYVSPNLFPTTYEYNENEQAQQEQKENQESENTDEQTAEEGTP